MVGHAHEQVMGCVITQADQCPQAGYEPIAGIIDGIEILLGKFHSVIGRIAIRVGTQRSQGVHKKNEHRNHIPENENLIGQQAQANASYDCRYENKSSKLLQAPTRIVADGICLTFVIHVDGAGGCAFPDEFPQWGKQVG